MVNKRRMLAIGEAAGTTGTGDLLANAADQLTGVRITDGQTYDRYERKNRNKH